MIPTANMAVDARFGELEKRLEIENQSLDDTAPVSIGTKDWSVMERVRLPQK